MELLPAVPARPRRAVDALHPLLQRQAGAARHGGQADPHRGPLTVNHLGQLPSVTMSFNLRPGVAWARRWSEISRWSASCALPATLSTSFQGTAQAFQSSLQGLGCCCSWPVLVIYLVLGILYESFIHPLTILSGLPSAGLGALLTLLIFNHGSEPLRLRRHHHAGRHREEERHHDDRLRHRRPAQEASPPPRRSTRAACCASARS